MSGWFLPSWRWCAGNLFATAAGTGFLNRLNNGLTEGSIDIAEFKELKNPLVIQKTDLEQQIVALEGSKLKRLEPLRKWVWVLEANAAQNEVISDNWLKMKSFL